MSNLKKKPLILLAIVGSLVLILASLKQWLPNWKNNNNQLLSARLQKIPDRSMIKIVLADREYLVEVVNSSASLTQGLSDREQIGSDGMLFVMPAKTFQTFWMPRMKFNLDILWLDEGKVVQIMENVPAPTADQALWQLPLYTSEKPTNLILEIPSGRVQLMKIKVGDQLTLKN